MKKLESVLNIIYKKSPLQKKKIEKHFLKKNPNFFDEFENFLCDYENYLENQNISFEYAINTYLKLCSNVMKWQIDFIKNGKYPTNTYNNVLENVYQNSKEMTSYMIGLAISQFLWENHYKIYNFFKNYLSKNYSKINSYLEIGPGHGLYLNKALDYINDNSEKVIVDISSVSIEITKSIIDYFRPEIKNISYYNIDIFDLNLDRKFDFITSGEVLEHVKNPELFLSKIRELLYKNGRAFISTCVNCPAIDHLYHFKYIDEIKNIIISNGFEIEKELILPIEDLPMDEIISKKITINYCSIIKKKSYV